MREKACELDIHKKFILAVVIYRDGVMAKQLLTRTHADLLVVKDWFSITAVRL